VTEVVESAIGQPGRPQELVKASSDREARERAADLGSEHQVSPRLAFPASTRLPTFAQLPRPLFAENRDHRSRQWHVPAAPLGLDGGERIHPVGSLQAAFDSQGGRLEVHVPPLESEGFGLS